MTIPSPPPSIASDGPFAFGSADLAALIGAIADGAAARERGEASALEAIGLVRGARLGAFRLPRHEGGAGGSLRELFEIVITLGEADSNIPHILRNHFAFVERALRNRAVSGYERWLDAVRAGRLFGLGASELGTQNIGDGASDTLLVPSQDGFRLSGRKYYSTGNLYADLLFINARTPDGAGVAAIIPADRAGVDLTDDWDGIGQQLTASGTTVLEDVAVAADEVVPLAQERRIPHEATFQQLYLTAIIAGILRAVARDAAALLIARQRNYYHAVAAKPAEDPQLQETLGRLVSTAYVAEAAVLGAAEALEQAFASALAGPPDEALFREASLRAAKAKVVVDDLALTAATRLFDVGGASAAKRSARLDRHWRNIRTISSHNPVAYKARAIGRHVLDGTPLPAAAYF
ncbi:putative FMNH2-dependent monooxygenase SfnC [Methylobacterium crusticola]|uniref:FMNH2-dependent monooxygenase SfnC n=1 Tax=Methylobacterium crusticola TaxID=1697972 RepID=A0ABQ4R9C0_9HYPH|nr:acyl-CoA dehydrogenase [Methylobacterium crusticola]GJD53709.1 putative FMNH2-dependent monooxygenase SfnC [Methylobacterium crusticola]